jgi:hypothetical protein
VSLPLPLLLLLLLLVVLVAPCMPVAAATPATVFLTVNVIKVRLFVPACVQRVLVGGCVRAMGGEGSMRAVRPAGVSENGRRPRSVS